MNTLIRVDDVNWNPSRADDALRSLEDVAARLREKDDSRAVFLDIYIVVTRKVVELFQTPDKGGFQEPEWLSRMTGRFAEEALLAVRASLCHKPLNSAAWRFATYYPANRLTQPYQDALLGVSAHINHDLALIVHESIAAEANDPARLARYKHDYFQVNEILWTSIPESISLLVDRHGCAATARLSRMPLNQPILRRMLMETLRFWRARVWQDALALLHAPDEEQRRRIAERIDRRSGRIAQALCVRDALRLAADGVWVPFRLSLDPVNWPGVVKEPASTGRAEKAGSAIV